MARLEMRWSSPGWPILYRDELRQAGEDLLEELADEAVMSPGAWVDIQGEMTGVRKLLKRLGVDDV